MSSVQLTVLRAFDVFSRSRALRMRVVARRDCVLQRNRCTGSLGAQRAICVSHSCTGKHELVIRALGFREFRHLINVSAVEILDLEAVLAAAVTTLDGVVTSAPGPARINIFTADFEARRKAGFGRFLTEEQLAAHPGRTLDALLRNSMPGVRTYTQGSMMTTVSTCGLATTTGLVPGRAGTSGRCYLQVIVDNVVVYDKALLPGLFELRRFDVSFLAGVELYTPSQTPAEFNRGSSAACGTLVIWRKN